MSSRQNLTFQWLYTTHISMTIYHIRMLHHHFHSATFCAENISKFLCRKWIRAWHSDKSSGWTEKEENGAGQRWHIATAHEGVATTRLHPQSLGAMARARAKDGTLRPRGQVWFFFNSILTCWDCDIVIFTGYLPRSTWAQDAICRLLQVLHWMISSRRWECLSAWDANKRHLCCYIIEKTDCKAK